MANGTPSFTNPNWHEFQPSTIETGLAASVDNPATPSAFPLLQHYAMLRQNNEEGYGQAIDQLHSMQMAEFLASNQLARQKQSGDLLHQLTDPGAAGMALSMGLVPQTDAVTPWLTSLKANTTAKNYGEAGKGAEGFALGGFSGPGVTSVPQQVTGQPMTQGPTAMEKAQMINAQGRVAAANAGNGIRVSTTSIPDSTGQSVTLNGRAPVGGETAMAEHLKSLMPRVGAKTDDGSTSAPNIDPKVIATQKAAIPLIETQLKAKNPQGYADVKAGMMANGGLPYVRVINGQMHIVGKSGQPY